MYWIRIYPNFPAFSNSLQVLRGHLSQPDALYSHVMKTATDSRYSRIEWHEHSCLWKMLHHVACALPSTTFSGLLTLFTFSCHLPLHWNQKPHPFPGILPVTRHKASDRRGRRDRETGTGHLDNAFIFGKRICSETPLPAGHFASSKYSVQILHSGLSMTKNPTQIWASSSKTPARPGDCKCLVPVPVKTGPPGCCLRRMDWQLAKHSQTGKLPKFGRHLSFADPTLGMLLRGARRSP